MRTEQQKFFDETCESFAFAFDRWAAKNHLNIIGGKAYWISPNWVRYEMVVEYSEATLGKSSEAMAEVLFTSFKPDIDHTETVEIDGKTVEMTYKAINLNIAHKLVTVYGDNASSNDTFCDYFLNKLRVNFDEDPQTFTGMPRCLFQGRQSRVRCLAHIINLIAEAVFEAFRVVLLVRQKLLF
jgi:hypothetical protein